MAAPLVEGSARRGPSPEAITAIARGLLFTCLAAVTLTTWCEGLWTVAVLHAALLLTTALLLMSRTPLAAGGETSHGPRGRWPAPARAIEGLLLAAAGWGLVQAMAGITVYRHETLAGATYWTAIAALFWLCGRLFGGEERATQGLEWFLYFAGGMALLCLVQRFTSQGRFLWAFDTGYLDIYGPFASYKDYAAFAELAFPLAVFKALQPSPRRWLYAGLGALLFASVVMSASRAGAVVLAAEFCLVLALMMGKRPWRDVLPAGLAVTVLAVALSAAGGGDRLWQRLQQPDPYAYRGEVARAALAMVGERPWSGFGMGNFPVAYPAYARFDDGTRVNHAHNDWVEWAVEGGIPLAAAMLAILVLAIPAAWRSVWGVGVIGVFVHALVDYPFRRLGVAGWIFFVLAGLVNGAARRAGAPREV